MDGVEIEWDENCCAMVARLQEGRGLLECVCLVEVSLNLFCRHISLFAAFLSKITIKQDQFHASVMIRPSGTSSPPKCLPSSKLLKPARCTSIKGMKSGWRTSREISLSRRTRMLPLSIIGIRLWNRGRKIQVARTPICLICWTASQKSALSWLAAAKLLAHQFFRLKAAGVYGRVEDGHRCLIK